MSRTKKIVLFLSFALFVVWGLINLGRISSDDEWIVRFVLGTLFAVSVIFRPKRAGGKQFGLDGYSFVPLSAACLGAALSLSGMIFNVNQFEWFGLIILLYACLSWALPATYGMDVLIASFIIYWIHPLPGQLFGKMEIAMQWISVQGAEGLLHALNERVWADNMILYTGFRVFGVPEACSGMRTAVTVLLCVLGTCVLMRIRWYNVLVFLVLGLLQVMLVNIVRISFMVKWADHMPVGWGETFLHDSLGIFLLATILLVQLEIICWRKYISRKRTIVAGIASGELEEEDKATIMPLFWQFVFAKGKYVILAVAILAGVAFLAFKQRPYHRAMMYYDVVESLMESDPVAAEKAIDEALALLPGDRELLVRRISVFMQRNKPELVLREIDKIGVKGDLTLTAIKSWALMFVGRLDEAVGLIKSLPEDVQALPRVAMIKAEQGAALDNLHEVKANILLASQDPFVLDRVRQLFLYLAAHGMWETIVKVDDSSKPYKEFPSALASVQAGIRVDDILHAGAVMRYALEKWPDDVRLLSNLFELANRSNNTSPWEAIFAERMIASIESLDADRLAAYIDYSLRLARPDLAWLAYARLRDLDADDPMLSLAPATHGGDWFVFDKHHLGLAGANKELIDLKKFADLTLRMHPMDSFWKHVPLAEELCLATETSVRAKYMRASLAELSKREKDGKLTRRMHKSYPMVLALSGNFEKAHAVQSQLADLYPDMKPESQLARANFFSMQQRWDEAYEQIRQYYLEGQYVTLEAEIALANILMNLDMGAVGLVVAQRAATAYPESVEARQMIALIWNAYGFCEDALHILKTEVQKIDSRVLVRLYENTGRYSAAEKVRKSAGLPDTRTVVDKDVFGLVPVEAILSPELPAPLTESEMDAEASKVEAKLAGLSSPFLRDYNTLLLEWYRMRGAFDAFALQRWENTGRDSIEKSFVLSRLAVLLARQQDKTGAVKAIVKALEYQPESVFLHRLAVMISGTQEDIDRAREACPHDPEIWLASLAARCIENKDKSAFEAQIEAEMIEVVDKKLYSIGSIVRAGDYLLRQKYMRPAEVLMRYAIKNADGYLPAYVVGMRCALDVRDTNWALKCALEGVDNALDPASFYKMLVMIKAKTGERDAELVMALQNLQEQFPDDKRWTENLGFVLFETGATAQARRVLRGLMTGGRVGNAGVGAMLVAAETSRLERDNDDSIRILDELYSLHPRDFKVLNNLIYSLAQNPVAIGRARSLLPALLEMADDEFIVHDTAAVVYMKCGQIASARQHMNKAISLLDEKSYSALEISLNNAEIMIAEGNLAEAKEIVQNVRKTAGLSGLISSRATELSAKIKKAEEQ